MANTYVLLNAVTTAVPTNGAVQYSRNRPGTIQASVVGTGAVTATVLIYGRNGVLATDWMLLGTITLSGTTSAADGFALACTYQDLYASVTAISGTGAAVTCTLAEA